MNLKTLAFSVLALAIVLGFAACNPPTGSSGTVAITKVSGTPYYTLVLKADGTLWASGANNANGDTGLIGLGATAVVKTFTPVASGVKDMAAGWYGAQLIKNDGSLWVTGDNVTGQFGDGTALGKSGASKSLTFKMVRSNGSSAISANTSTFLVEAGWLQATGDNTSGKLGVGTFALANFLSFTSAAPDPTKLVSGASHSAYINATGELYMAGNNANGPLGLGDKSSRNTFAKVSISGFPAARVHEVALGGWHSIAIVDSTATPNQGFGDKLWVSGNNGSGQLGYGILGGPDEINGYILTVFPASTHYAKVAAGSAFSAVLLTDGSVWVCGQNESGQLGNGSYGTDSPTFTKLTDGAKEIWANNSNLFVLKTDGSLWASGDNGSYQLGIGDNPARQTSLVRIMN